MVCLWPQFSSARAFSSIRCMAARRLGFDRRLAAAQIGCVFRPRRVRPLRSLNNAQLNAFERVVGGGGNTGRSVTARADGRSRLKVAGVFTVEKRVEGDLFLLHGEPDQR